MKNLRILMPVWFILGWTSMHAQVFYDNAALFENQSGGAIAISSFTASGFTFNSALEYDAYTSPGGQNVTLGIGDQIGFNAPNTSGGTTGGNIVLQGGSLPCAKQILSITYNGGSGFASIDLDFIDANWGLATNISQLHRIKIVYTGQSGANEFLAYVEDPANPEQFLSTPCPAGTELKYWVAVQTCCPTCNYTRDRTGHNNTYFTLTGGDVPISGYPDDRITLDVNVNVTGAITVPDGHTFIIEADPLDPFYPLYHTTLSFDNYTYLTVYGQLHTNWNRIMPNNEFGNTLFQPSAQYPQPGDWLGIQFLERSAVGALKNTWIKYAQNGLSADSADIIISDHLTVDSCSYNGIVLTETFAWCDSTWCSDNQVCGILIQGTYWNTQMFDHLFVTRSGETGVLVLGANTTEFNNSDVSWNGFDGFYFTNYAQSRLKNCRIHHNAQYPMNPIVGDGVHAFNCTGSVYVQNSCIYNNVAGISADNLSTIKGCYGNGDCDGYNCVHDNYYNLFCDHGGFEMASTQPSPPAYLGGLNDILNPGSGTQGYFKDCVAHLDANYWGPSAPGFTIINSTVTWNDPTPTVNTECCNLSPAPGGFVSGEETESNQLYTQWQNLAQTPVLLRQSILASYQSLTKAQLVHAFWLVTRSSTPQDAVTFYSTLLSGNPSLDLRTLASFHLEKAYVSLQDWSNALRVCTALLPYLTLSGSSDYTKTHVMAAFLQNQMDNRAEALVRLDSILTAYPTDPEVIRAWHALGGRARSPKARSMQPAASQYALDDAFPNPFNPSTMIRFTIPEAQNVRLVVSNSLGEVVATLADKAFPEGSHIVIFDASTLPSGVYLYTISAGDFTQTKKMVLTK
jgi:hypothetical protein